MSTALGAAVAVALETEGLAFLAVSAVLAGMVRGFTGFGAGLVFLPLAAIVTDPITALVALLVMEFFGPLPILRGAWRQAHSRDALRLGLGAAVALPFGVWVLTLLDPAIFRLAVSVIALAMLAMLLGGFRYTGPMRGGLIYATGGLCGFLAGSTGLPGPPAILLYMARPLPAAVVRATLLIFLVITMLLMMASLAVAGLMGLPALMLGLGLALPSMLGNLLGAWLFDPAREGLYRVASYLLIAGAALAGLPFWG